MIDGTQLVETSQHVQRQLVCVWVCKKLKTYFLQHRVLFLRREIEVPLLALAKLGRLLVEPLLPDFHTSYVRLPELLQASDALVTVFQLLNNKEQHCTVLYWIRSDRNDEKITITGDFSSDPIRAANETAVQRSRCGHGRKLLRDNVTWEDTVTPPFEVWKKNRVIIAARRGQTWAAFGDDLDDPEMNSADGDDTHRRWRSPRKSPKRYEKIAEERGRGRRLRGAQYFRVKDCSCE